MSAAAALNRLGIPAPRASATPAAPCAASTRSCDPAASSPSPLSSDCGSDTLAARLRCPASLPRSHPDPWEGGPQAGDPRSGCPDPGSSRRRHSMLPSIPTRPFRPRQFLWSHPLPNGPLPPLHVNGEGCPQGGVRFASPPRPPQSPPADCAQLPSGHTCPGGR